MNMSPFYAVWDSLFRLVYSPHCYICRKEIDELPGEDRLLNRFFCPDCHRALIINPWLGCNFCGAYRTEGRSSSRYCVHCRGEKFAFDQVVTLGMFDGLLREAIYMIKKPEHVYLARALAESLYRTRLKGSPILNVDWIVPAPMHKNRFQERGINDADVIAQRLSDLSGIKYVDALSRTAVTALQRKLSPQQRRENVRGAFEWRWHVDTEKPPKSVLIVDDVLTTGATCNEIAKMMKSIGVETVYVAVIARAVGD